MDDGWTPLLLRARRNLGIVPKGHADEELEGRRPSKRARSSLAAAEWEKLKFPHTTSHGESLNSTSSPVYTDKVEFIAHEPRRTDLHAIKRRSRPPGECRERIPRVRCSFQCGRRATCAIPASSPQSLPSNDVQGSRLLSPSQHYCPLTCSTATSFAAASTTASNLRKSPRTIRSQLVIKIPNACSPRWSNVDGSHDPAPGLDSGNESPSSASGSAAGGSILNQEDGQEHTSS